MREFCELGEEFSKLEHQMNTLLNLEESFKN